GCRRGTPWCWSTMVPPAARNCCGWRAASRHPSGSGSAWRWSRSLAWWVPAGEDRATAACRLADARQHAVLRHAGDHHPIGVRTAALVRSRLLPIVLRHACRPAAAAPPRHRAAEDRAVPAIHRALPAGHRIDVLRLLGNRQPATGARGVAVLFVATVRDHRGRFLAWRAGPG